MKKPSKSSSKPTQFRQRYQNGMKATFSATVHSTQISRQNQQTKSDKKTKTSYLILLTKFLINFPYFSSFELIMRFFERVYLFDAHIGVNYN